MSIFEEALSIIADVSISEDYSDIDKYHDFRKVFLETEEGRRVLRQVMSWGGLLKTHFKREPIDPYSVVAREGMRNLSLMIFFTMLKEPKSEKPIKQKQTDED